MIEATELTKYFGDKMALDGLSLKVETGETVGLVGRNGAGKSTILRILSCQLLPSSGEVRIGGTVTAEHPRAVRAKIGFLPETVPLYPEMTVKDYLGFAAGIRRIPRNRIDSARDEAMAGTGLKEVAHERLGNLSRGFQQRVGIAQAIVHRPELVLLDEPMAGLDPLQITEIRALIQGLKGRHTVLFSSHNLGEITKICDRIILIDKGRVRVEGSESQLWETLHHRLHLVLLLRGAPEKAVSIAEGVEGVEVKSSAAEGEGKTRLEVSANPEARETLSQALMQGGLGLLEMRAEHHGLEDLFYRLIETPTSPETPAPPETPNTPEAP